MTENIDTKPIPNPQSPIPNRMTENIDTKPIPNPQSPIPNPQSPIPNVLCLSENYPPQRGGMAVSCDRIVRSLRQMGVNMDVAHFSSRYLRWKTEQKINGRQFSCPVREDIAHAINRLWNLVENTEYTHIVAFGGLLPMTAGPVFAAWLDIPLITLIRGNDFDTGIFSLKRGDILRQALERSAVVCAVSQDKVKKISALYPNKRIVWTPNGIDLNDWEFSIEDLRMAEKFRADNGVKSNQRVLGLFGQLKRKKGGLFFLENLLRSGLAARFHLLLIGDVDTEMSDWLENHRESINFTNLPFLDRFELLPYYAACDFVVIPSFYDGMPNVLLEAAALGIPSIASNTGGMRDVLKDPETAILFETGNEDSCRQAIERVAHIKEDLAGMKERCLNLAREFSPQNEAQKYLEVFAETTHKRSYYAEK